MSKHLLEYCAYNALQKEVDKSLTQGKVTMANRTQSMASRIGVEVSVGDNLQVEVSEAELWPVSQQIRIDPSNEDDCQYVGPVDEGARSLYSYQVGDGAWRHVFYGALTLFRDASARRKAEGLKVLPNYSWDVLAFPGAEVFSGNLSSVFLDRFAASVSRGVASYDPNVPLYDGSTNGQLCYLMTPDNSTKPRLAAVYVPNGLDWNQPVPVLAFLTPYTNKKGGNYPWSTDFNAMLDNYLINAGKRLLAQINASRRQCIFVFPIPLPQTFYSAFTHATDLRRYLLEVVYWLQRKIGHQRFPEPRLGHCAIAAFSGGGSALRNILQSAANGEFDELLEVYGLDAINEAAYGGYAAFRTALGAWWNVKRSDKRIRFYETERAGSVWAQLGPSLGLAQRGLAVSGALEYQGTNATTAWLPTSFWEKIWSEDPDPRHEVLGHFPVDQRTASPVRPTEHTVHQVIPGIFLQHALANSAFALR